MIDSWRLATISMWYERLDKEVVIKLICDKFTWDDLWEAAVELNQECATRDMSKKIPKNHDLGDMKDRVKVLAAAVIGSIQELKSRVDSPVFVVSSGSLFQVPGVLKDAVEVEPAVTARLDNIEKMMETLNKGFKEIKEASSKMAQVPAIHVNDSANSSVSTANLAPHNRARSVSPSMKRKAAEAQLQSDQPGQQQEEEPWSKVVGRGGNRNNNKQQGRRERPVQHGTAKVKVAGGEAAPYDVVIGNTNPASTEEIIKSVLIHVAENMEGDSKLQEPLNILEVECLTKPRKDGSRIWTRTWRVQVPARFKEYMLLPEAYPAGWTCRRYFPPRAERQAVPDLYPAGGPPPGKRQNLGGQDNS